MGDLFSALPDEPEKKNPAPNAAKPAAAKPKLSAVPKAGGTSGGSGDYDADSIRVLEGLEAVRMRPGMYIGGKDEKAYHHLFAEIIDNSMDEAVAGHANWIEVHLSADGSLTVTDNGRGIPVAEHSQIKGKSALEVIMTTLHAGGKFDSDAYETSGGLHGVGASVVNALSDHMIVEVARDRELWRQTYAKGVPTSAVEKIGAAPNRRGTTVTFHPDPEIFGPRIKFDAARLMSMAQSKAYLYGGVEVRWSCDPEQADAEKGVPEKTTFHYPGGVKDFLADKLAKQNKVMKEIFSGSTKKSSGHGAMQWAVSWFAGDGFVNSYCNTVPTPDGGTHEAGLRIALTRGLKAYAELTQNKKGAIITTDDVMTSAGAMLSVYIREPEFVGQTKDKLATVEAQKIVENAVRDPFDHWLAASPGEAQKLLEWVIERAEERLRRRKEKEVSRQSATRKLRLPGKLADCSQKSAEGAEIFIVEGDSAGGSAKQARNRHNQAVLPLRGKILNVANASRDKQNANQLIQDLIQALGCGTRSRYNEDDLRYEKVIIMTDADVDGAHIASLLITFFYQEMPDLIRQGHLYLAMPPLYRITQGAKTLYAKDDAHKDQLIETEFQGRGKIDVGRFKGLGEMMPRQLKETTMDRASRTMMRVAIRSEELDTRQSVDRLMGNKPEARFNFIQENAEFVEDLDV
jgi:topoisomerase-4 subunit B